jgi:hypothetical protein
MADCDGARLDPVDHLLHAAELRIGKDLDGHAVAGDLRDLLGGLLRKPILDIALRSHMGITQSGLGLPDRRQQHGTCENDYSGG